MSGFVWLAVLILTAISLMATGIILTSSKR